MSIPEVFKGFGSRSPKNWNNPELIEYKPRKFNDEDVLIKIEACGVCGSDHHTITGNWGPYHGDHTIVGHEVVGTVLKVGKDVKSIKVGDSVGVGAQSGSCGECKSCLSDNEQYCKKMIGTYNSVNYKADNYVTQGGYASHIIAQESNTFPIPENLPKDLAGPLMCGGLTVFSPLYRSLGDDASGKVVGVIGIGGLGHLAIKFAKALGAKVVAFSRSSAKKQDALELGADEYVATGEEEDWPSKYDRDFDVLINCASSFTDIKFENFLPTLKIRGHFINVGAPSADELMSLHAFQLILSGAALIGSAIGSKKEAIKMLKLAADKKIYPVVERLPMTKENVKIALERVGKSDVRYRFVLTDVEKAFD